jgi:hypothetical protein
MMIVVGIARGILVTAVLPAEYRIDPTGVGRVFGLTQMGEIKQHLAAEAERDASAGQATSHRKGRSERPTEEN